LVVTDGLKELLAKLEDGQRFLLLLHGKIDVFDTIELNWWDVVVWDNHGLGRLLGGGLSFGLELPNVFAVLGEL
jgi:hypothetical protein